MFLVKLRVGFEMLLKCLDRGWLQWTTRGLFT